MKTEIILSIALIFLLNSKVSARSAPFVISNGREGRIIGGERSEENEFPFFRKACNIFSCCPIVSLNRNWAITTASCIAKGAPPFENKGNVVIHPRYNAELNLFDVALLNLQTDLETYVTLPARNEDVFHGTDSLVIGYDSDMNVEKADVKTLNLDECRKQFPDKVSNNMICAGGSEANACIDDLASPLMVGNKLIGIYSWGDEDCSSGKPGVFMRIAHQEILDFIKNTIEG